MMTLKNLSPISLLILLIGGFTLLYITNLGGWLTPDDEGTDFYEAWQLQIGQQPGVDFFAEQQPLFLLVGKAVIDVAGREATALRLLSVIQIMLGTLALAYAVWQIWGLDTAVLTTGFILVSGLVVEQARLYRPDPMMLAWEMAGLTAVLLAIHKQKTSWWAVAGAAYGVAFLYKLFGLFPLFGLIFFFLHQLWRNPHERRTIFINGLWFATTFLLVSVGISILLYSQTGFYYLEAVNQHLSIGQGKSLWLRTKVVLGSYAAFFLVNAIFVFAIPLWLLNRRRTSPISTELQLILWLLVSPVIIIGITRPVFLRYFIFLTPMLAILTAWHFHLVFHNILKEQARFRIAIPILILALIGFAALVTQPPIEELLTRQETDTIALAELVATHTEPEAIVLSDYAGINFFANRASIYEASIIAAGRIRNGIVTGALLIERLEQENVALILIHVEGGPKEPDHLVFLQDYDLFRAYLDEHYELINQFDRNGQLIEIHQKQIP